MADVFVDARSRTGLTANLARFVELLFGHPFHTPTRDEYAMFHAHAAALRSADLARQGGAAITNEEGDIVAVGCNDVPKSGGGLYWADDLVDHRDFRLGHDTNALFRRDLVTQMVVRLREAGLLSSKLGRAKPDAIARNLLKNKVFKETIAANVIEFGRSVHAEMAALTNAANRGIAVAGGTLFSTVFPCHLCTRHIVAAGIRRVVYVEPYPKSVAGRLYADSIVIDPIEDVTSKVLFKPFVGIAPAKYTEMFKMRVDRKLPSGKSVNWSPVNANPTLRRFVLSYVQIETMVIAGLLPELFDSLERKLASKKRG